MIAHLAGVRLQKDTVEDIYKAAHYSVVGLTTFGRSATFKCKRERLDDRRSEFDPLLPVML